MKKLKTLWASLFGDADRRIRLGRIVGLLFITGGFVAISLAWNGAAGKNSPMAQFPYLLSGGMLGLAMVITGATLLFLSTIRAERQLLTDRFDEMARLLSRNLGRMSISANGSASAHEHVVAGTDVYHRPDCRILEGKTGLMAIPVEQAVAEGLAACRACAPPVPAEVEEKTPSEPVSSN